MNDNYIAASCAGKVSFASFKLANAVVTRNSDKHRDGRTSYHCQYCHQWHVGADNGRQSRERYERRNSAE